MPPGKRTHFYPEELTLRSDAKEEWHESTFLSWIGGRFFKKLHIS
jgi:hypothetical protein